MTEAAKILQMIESVSIDDTDMLDEIDELTVSYLGGKVEERFYGDSLVVREETFGFGFYQPVRKYTRSRDAIKSIRPDGWTFQLYTASKSGEPYKYKDLRYQCNFNFWDGYIYKNGNSEELITEELAELHAVIQAIDFERSQPPTEKD